MPQNKKIVISTRNSKLALWQASYVKELLLAIDSNLDVTIKDCTTIGDRVLNKPLYKIGGKGLFTKEVQKPLINGEAHIAVHCLKDIPNLQEQNNDLVIGAFLPREDSSDLLLSNDYKSLKDMPSGSIIGSTSLRRRMQISSIRKDIIVKDLRGNLDTRIKALNDGAFDAIVLARAGVKRLGYNDRFKYIYDLSNEKIVPSAGQGTLVIESINNESILNLVSKLNDEKSKQESLLELSFVRSLDGDCGVPIGVKATIDDVSVVIDAVVGKHDGSKVIKHSISASLDQSENLAETFAKIFINDGAIEIIKESKKELGIE